MIDFNIVPITYIDQAFPFKILQKAIERGRGDLTLDYLLSECRSARATLAVFGVSKVETAIIFRFENWSGKKVCHILALAGGGHNWDDQMSALAEYAEPYASKIVFSGRIGWQRRLKSARVVSQSYELEI